MVALLDVNILLALVDRMHSHHHIAHDWFADVGSSAWATCPITQNGLVRILSQPKYRNAVESPQMALSALRGLTGHSGHHFWHDDVSLLDEALFLKSNIHSHSQVTDTYLLALAAHHNGMFATFDSKIIHNTVNKGDKHLLILR